MAFSTLQMNNFALNGDYLINIPLSYPLCDPPLMVFGNYTQKMDNFSHVLPPGFRFHPSDEQLVDYYLRKKIASKGIDLDIIKDVDLYKIEPWDLEELCKTVGSTDNQNEWYFFSHKDKKYPTGTRTNRATKAGFWKATGRDKAIYRRNMLVGMRKTLVFYEGRAPSGQKSDWIMHEYRLETNENGTTQEEGWVVCRVFKKRLTTVRKMGDYESPGWYDQVSFMPEIDNSPRRPSISHHPNHVASPYNHHHHHQQQHQQHYSQCKQELDLRQYNINMIPHHHLDSFLQLPQLESPRLPHQSDPSYGSNCVLNNQPNLFNSSSSSSAALYCNNNDQQGVDQVTDWRVLDKFVASQLSHDDGVPKEVGTNYSNNNAASSLFHVGEHMNMFANEAARRAENDVGQDYASTSTSSCQIDLWK